MTHHRPASPKHCQSCIPVVTYGDWTTEYRHESECPERKPQA